MSVTHDTASVTHQGDSWPHGATWTPPERPGWISDPARGWLAHIDPATVQRGRGAHRASQPRLKQRVARLISKAGIR